ncbi:MAG: hypothetical protein IPM51_02440 [Sphingobacteriaceae bacterium]|nr:hypothetical protein [Sphingobacteriaceae bacterium]
MRKILATTFFTAVLFSSIAQDSLSGKKKGHFYGSWGYTRAIYSKSDIHLKDLSGNYHPATGKNNYYDFKVLQATASDRPDFDRIPDIINITIPQFVFRVGYYFSENSGIEMNYDHTKYVVNRGQRVHIVGQIDGIALDKDTTLSHDFLDFEHTDGANFWMINYLKKWKLHNGGKKIKAFVVVKPGGGIVFPRTDVRLFGERLNNDWKISGVIAGVEAGFRVELFDACMFEIVSKGAYANYINAFVLGKGNGKASHSFYSGQLTATLGFIINYNKKK